MKIGDGDEHRTESGLKDEMSDQDGKSFGWMPRFVIFLCSLALIRTQNELKIGLGFGYYFFEFSIAGWCLVY